MAWALADEHDVGGWRVGPWRLQVRLGHQTWRGIDEATGAAVVVRVAPAGTPDEGAVRAEAAALTALGPLCLPGLVRPAGEAEGPGVAAVATVAVAGSPLAERLHASEALSWPMAAAVLAPVADALAAVHDAGWVHGDVAPANIVATDAGGVLVDLGCARAALDAGATGTPGWVAPEVIAGARVGPASEVWSLATIAAALVSGGASGPLPAGAAIGLRRALAEDPADRPTAGELAAVLHLATGCHAGDDLATAITRDYGPRPPAPPTPSPVPTRRAGPMVAVVVLVATVAVWSWSRSQPDTVAPPARPPAGECPAVPADARIVGDPDGDGCEVAATWSDGVLTVALTAGAPPSRIAVGAPGDTVAVGDWDCDGVDTPAAYRPTTGTVTLWNEWPTTDRAAGVAPSDVRAEARAGTASVEVGADGCDHVVVATTR